MPDQWNAFVVGPRALALPTGTGALDSLSFGVKDIIDVAGLPTGRGLAGPSQVAASSNPAVAALLDAGATCAGKTTTDQLAFSLSGTDTATPAPLNPRDASRLVGGSSSGSAAAVAGRLVAFALSTDTAGSVRVPASYCGVVGFRPTWGVVPLDGVSPLAPRFDTIGWHARDVRTAAAVGTVVLPAAPRDAVASFASVVLIEEAMDAVDHGTSAVVSAAASALGRDRGLPLRRIRLGIPLTAVGRSFRGQQLADIAASPKDAATLAAALPGVRARFAAAEAAGPADGDLVAMVDTALAPLRRALADGAIVVLPAAAGPAPARHTVDGDDYARHRDLTIAVNAFAGLLGAPSLVTPAGGGTEGVAYLAAPGSDHLLLRTFTEEPASSPPADDAILTAFYRYESALVSGDRATLDGFFAADSPCIRFAPEGAAYSRAEIASLRAAGATPPTDRDLLDVSVEQLTADVAVTAVRFRRRPSGVRGYQTQTWRRDADGWRIRLAHVSLIADQD